MPPPPWANLGRVAAARPVPLKKPVQPTEGREAGPLVARTHTSSLSPSHLLSLACSVLFTVDDAASLSFSLPPASFPCALSPDPTSPPAPGGPDPDAAGARAHWGAGAEPATGEGAGRAAAPRISRQQGNAPARRLQPARLARWRPWGSSVLLFSLSLTAVLILFHFCALSRREVEVQEHAYTALPAPLPRDAYWGRGGMAVYDFAPQLVPLTGSVL